MAALPSLARLSDALQWLILSALSALLAGLLEALHLPGALLLGPMAAAMSIAVSGGVIQIPPVAFSLAQAFIGCMVARAMPPSILDEMLRHWGLFASTVIAVIAASAVLGWLLSRWGVLPGTAAVWGSFPGAATAMMLMAEAYGADIRLVAIMQYLRVFLVVAVASVVSRLWVGTAPSAHWVWFPPLAWTSLSGTCLLAVAGVLVAQRLRITAGSLLVPLVVGAVLQDTGRMRIELPPWLLAVSYATVGVTIGLRFTSPLLLHAARALPRIAASILVLIGLCGGIAAVLVFTAGVDPLTAYLATTPGGADSAAIIAASSRVDLPFVMAMQTARFLLVLLSGPTLARFIARRVEAPGGT